MNQRRYMLRQLSHVLALHDDPFILDILAGGTTPVHVWRASPAWTDRRPFEGDLVRYSAKVKITVDLAAKDWTGSFDALTVRDDGVVKYTTAISGEMAWR
jgi:hypothetical protein